MVRAETRRSADQGHAPPQATRQRATQAKVQELLQQLGQRLQTQLWQGQPPQPGVEWGWHMSAQLPQSFEQFWQFSPRDCSHLPLPQLHSPQSVAQLEQVS